MKTFFVVGKNQHIADIFIKIKLNGFVDRYPCGAVFDRRAFQGESDVLVFPGPASIAGSGAVAVFREGRGGSEKHQAENKQQENRNSFVLYHEKFSLCELELTLSYHKSEGKCELYQEQLYQKQIS